VLIQGSAVVTALTPYTLEGAYGRLVDGANEEIATSDLLHLELEDLMPHKALLAPVLTYLFHRLEARFDGRPTLVVLDEAWTFLDDATFAARIREWLKTLRKKNVAVVFATQSLADIERSSIAPALIESCPTRIFLPNERALEPQARVVYERFGLNSRQIEILSRATPKRDYYAQTARGNRLFELGLGAVGLTIAARAARPAVSPFHRRAGGDLRQGPLDPRRRAGHAGARRPPGPRRRCGVPATCRHRHARGDRLCAGMGDRPAHQRGRHHHARGAAMSALDWTKTARPVSVRSALGAEARLCRAVQTASLTGASTPDDQKLIDRLANETAPPEFPAAFLRAKRPGWAAELIESAAATAHSSSAPVPPREEAPASRPTLPPLPNATAQRPASTAAQPPRPGLPSGPPMSERLSPYRAPETKRKGERR